MYLTDEEKKMASGERGEAVRLSMEILTKVGTIYGAERMVEVNSVHASAVYPHLTASVELMENYERMGGRFCVPTTVNPAHTPINFDKWKEYREPEERKEKCSRLVRAIVKMGVIPNWSCIPFFQGNLPRMGEPVAWVESSAVSFANSVLGARANRTAAGVEIPVAITGRAPEFGLYLEENRIGNALVRVETRPRTLFDYHTLGYIIGKRFSDRIPVIEGLPEQTTTNQLKAMGASAASRGVVPLYHAVGLTPEAKTREQAFKGQRPSAEITITEKDVKTALEEVTTYRGGDLDAIVIGCPHPLLEEIRELAFLLEGRRVREGMKFCLFISSDVAQWAERMGYMDVLRKAGVDLFEGDCINFCPVATWGWKNVATDSAKYANILPSDPTYLNVLYVPAEECVELGTR